MSSNPTVSHLLILSCSNRKIATAGEIPAIDRYDGGAYRVIRKARREGNFPDNLDIYILSAKFGLIHANHPIPDYDLRMTKTRAIELQNQVYKTVASDLSHQKYESIYVDLGGDYLPAIEGCIPLINTNQMLHAQGRIGERLRALKLWLYAI